MRKELLGYGLCLVLIVAFFLWPDSGSAPKRQAPSTHPYTMTVGTGEPELSADPSAATPAATGSTPQSNPTQTSGLETTGTTQQNTAAQTATGTTTQTAPTQQTNPGSVYIQGDSLSVDLQPRLDKLLPDWNVELSAASGRHISAGLNLLSKTQLPEVVVWALGTNDYDLPSSWQRTQLMKVLSIAGPDRCVVIPTVWGDGAARASINNPIYALAAQYGPKRIQVMPWAEAVGSGQVALSDGTHPKSWSLRSQMMANSIQKCSAQLGN